MNNMKRLIQLTFWLPLAAVILAATMLPQTTMGAVRYVKTTGTGNGENSWGNASNDLQAVINASASGDEVWVFAGIYKPKDTAVDGATGDGGRDNAFVLKAGVKIYGGFTSNVSGTDAPEFGETGRIGTSTLSGDIDGISGLSANDAYHVVIGAHIVKDSGALLDGFTITGGNADESNTNSKTVNGKIIRENCGGGIYNGDDAFPVLTNLIIIGNNASSVGGGIYNRYSSPVLINDSISNNTAFYGGGIGNAYASPTLTDVIISENYTSSNGGGGGIYNAYSSPTLTDVIIRKNTATMGGGIYEGESPSVLTRVTISENEASYGGGMYIQSYVTSTYSDPELTNVTINKNKAYKDGGGIFNTQYATPELDSVIISENEAALDGGGIYNHGVGTSPTLTNVTISGNSSGANGGGIANLSFSTPTLTNVLISGNKANGSGGGMHNSESTPTLTNVTIGVKAATGNGGGIDNLGNSSPELTNTIVWGNSTPNVQNRPYNDNGDDPKPEYEYSLVQEETLGGTNLDGKNKENDPLFVYPQKAGSAPTTEGDYRLRPDSPADKDGEDENYLGAYKYYPFYSIALKTDQTFTTTFGYTSASLPVTFTNTGNQPTGTLNVAVSATNGTNINNFVITGVNYVTDGIKDIYDSKTITVALKTGLNAGTYTATITVGGNENIDSQIFNILFTVNKATLTLDNLDYEMMPDTVYSGEPYPVPATVKPAITGFGTITVNYNGSTNVPITPGEYEVTVDSDGNGNYNAVSLKLGTFKIKKTTPSPDHFDFDLGPLYVLSTDGARHGIAMPTLKSPYEGLGDITVKYDYDVLRPMGLGSFLVTLDITDGDNFEAIDSLVLGYFVVNSLPSYPVVREVLLPDVEGVDMSKTPGRHFIDHGSSFEFTIYASAATAAHAPVVTTNRPDDKTKVTVTPNADGSYSVAILDVTEAIVIAIDVSGTDAIIGADAAAVWSSGGALYITASRPGQATVYTTAGVRIKTLTLAAGETAIDTTLAAGLYIVELEGKNSKVIISR
jgi:hypothetical protein